MGFKVLSRGLLNPYPDPLVRCTDLDPVIVKRTCLRMYKKPF
jgi:hypothetical protein